MLVMFEYEFRYLLRLYVSLGGGVNLCVSITGI